VTGEEKPTGAEGAEEGYAANSAERDLGDGEPFPGFQERGLAEFAEREEGQMPASDRSEFANPGETISVFFDQCGDRRTAQLFSSP
jgi:hypothetical protein